MKGHNIHVLVCGLLPNKPLVVSLQYPIPQEVVFPPKLFNSHCDTCVAGVFRKSSLSVRSLQSVTTTLLWDL